jgi:hypothetical protein
LMAAAQMVAWRCNWVLLEACGWGEERQGGVPAFYRLRRSVRRRRYFPASLAPARLERLPEAAYGVEASGAAAGQLVPARRGACGSGAGSAACSGGGAWR